MIPAMQQRVVSAVTLVGGIVLTLAMLFFLVTLAGIGAPVE